MLIDAARNGDDAAFRRLVEGERAALHAHCYRMLGSLHDAEDAFQETMLRAWRGLRGFEGRSSLRGWLYRIATNVCIDAIQRRRKRTQPFEYGAATNHGRETPGGPEREPAWIELRPDRELGIENGASAPEVRYERREAVELAFTAANQVLSARQRAVLILRDVLGFSAKESAVMLETTVTSINSALQRARRAVDERLLEQNRHASLSPVADARVRKLVERFVSALERDDVDAILALIAEDVPLTKAGSRELLPRLRRERRLLAHRLAGDDRAPRNPPILFLPATPSV